jgi:hypothetical protein
MLISDTEHVGTLNVIQTKEPQFLNRTMLSLTVRDYKVQRQGKLITEPRIQRLHIIRSWPRHAIVVFPPSGISFMGTFWQLHTASKIIFKL